MVKEIQFLKGVGPKRAAALAKIGIHTLADLIDFYPRKYLDRTTIVPVNKIKADEEFTVVGRVEAQGIHRWRKRAFYLVVSDGTEILKAVWFNNLEQFKRTFRVGDWVSLSGKVSYYRGFQMTHPDFDILGNGDIEKAINTGKILPIYPGNEILKRSGINSYALRKIFFENLANFIPEINENLPEKLKTNHGFLDRRESYKNIHLPESNSLLLRSIKRFKYEEFFFIQLLLALQRHHVNKEEPGIAFEKASKHLTWLFNKLPFEMTEAQKRVVKEIRADMKDSHPMNRLLQGDVGSGKTLVAIMAILVAIDNGFQAALMVPTEILAEQHFFNISEALKGTDISVNLLTGSTTQKQKESLLTILKSQQPHIVIGTHALIQKGVDFSRLGLIIIDEQHRFGVMQRASLLEKGVRADVLVMTATPIPRTLALTVYGNLDVSILDQMPPHREPIQTLWRLDEKAEQIYGFIRERLLKGEQAFVVFPLVEESEKMDLKAATRNYEVFKNKTFRNFKIALLHGRMKAEEKEKVMKSFVKGDIDLLVTTSVIEVGVDVSNATVMLIEHAERFGLSQLHQLRGRVGRGQLKSYCILKTPRNIGAIAQQRMKIMSETCDGFKIAEDDLKMRGWGEFFGTKQHGLPTFKIANPIIDHKLLVMARNDAFKLVEADPHLRTIENNCLREFFLEKYADKLNLINIS